MDRTIYLLGEYSGLYSNLRIGFEELGYKVCLISDGDGWKKIQGDININVSARGKSIFNRIYNRNLIGKETKRIIENLSIKKDDIVLAINTGFFTIGYASSIINTLKNKCNNIFISAVGDDCTYLRHGKKYRYWPHQGDEKKSILRYLLFNNRDKIVLNKVLKIIPGAYDYAEAYRHSRYEYKLHETIPMPVNLNSFEYKKNTVKEKIKVFHGINRRGFKGTHYIEKALTKIKEKYSDYVDVVIDGNMPFEEYVKVIDESNVIIDQCKSYSYGMNALFSLAKGKIVLSGFENECKVELGIEDEDCDTIKNILPDENQIYGEIEQIILSFLNDPDYFESMGKKSRMYVEKYHDHLKIAKKYIELFEIESQQS